VRRVRSQRMFGRATLVLVALLGILAMHGLPMQSAAPVPGPAVAHAVMHGVMHDLAAPLTDLAVSPPPAPGHRPGPAAHDLAPCAAVMPALHTLQPPAAVPSRLTALVIASTARRAPTVSTLRRVYAPPDLHELCISRT
jgi:hypothetical protein